MSTHSNKIVAVCQMTSGQDKSENLNTCENLIKSAKSQNASVRTKFFHLSLCFIKLMMSCFQMVFLPEACDYICETFTDVAKNAEPENGFVVSKFKSLARQYDVWLSIGGIHVKV